MPRGLLIALLGLLLTAGLYLGSGTEAHNGAVELVDDAGGLEAQSPAEQAAAELRKPSWDAPEERAQAHSPDPAQQPPAEADQEANAVARPVESSTPQGALWALLYEHASNHPEGLGNQWSLGPGLTTAGLAFANDNVSSVEVPPGVVLTLYVDGNGQGRRVVLPSGKHDLAALGFDHVVSSARVSGVNDYDPSTPRGPQDAVQLHQHLPREGEQGSAWNLRLAPSTRSHLYRAQAGVFDDNEASAAWVPAGYRLTLFDQADGFGIALVLGPGLHELSPYHFNDITSAARVERIDASR